MFFSINALKRTEVPLEFNKQFLILQLSKSLDFDQNILDKNQGFFQKDACQHQENILNKILYISAPYFLITEHQIIQKSISYMITTVRATISVLCTPKIPSFFSKAEHKWELKETDIVLRILMLFKRTNLGILPNQMNYNKRHHCPKKHVQIDKHFLSLCCVPGILL